MKKLSFIVLLVFLVAGTTAASDQEDTAANAITNAFLQARRSAHLSKLAKMGKNIFRKQVCKHDLRLPSGVIDDVLYETSDPEHLPESAQRLATTPDSYRIAMRIGIGVCLLSSNSGQPKYSVLIATYESRWTSFWRIFWE
jgi:hypothetical protein